MKCSHSCGSEVPRFTDGSLHLNFNNSDRNGSCQQNEDLLAALERGIGERDERRVLAVANYLSMCE